MPCFHRKFAVIPCDMMQPFCKVRYYGTTMEILNLGHCPWRHRYLPFSELWRMILMAMAKWISGSEGISTHLSHRQAGTMQVQVPTSKEWAREHLATFPRRNQG